MVLEVTGKKNGVMECSTLHYSITSPLQYSNTQSKTLGGI
jgi:hypothetical protein